uniref:Uncharacterized protein n=1 Tax=Populus alba TaxID=43335 RepID=A0A4U5MB10_POPAL|nr:hypothetical protein D5086_0000312730 [Populus alba]
MNDVKLEDLQRIRSNIGAGGDILKPDLIMPLIETLPLEAGLTSHLPEPNNSPSHFPFPRPKTREARQPLPVSLVFLSAETPQSAKPHFLLQPPALTFTLPSQPFLWTAINPGLSLSAAGARDEPNGDHSSLLCNLLLSPAIAALFSFPLSHQNDPSRPSFSFTAASPLRPVGLPHLADTTDLPVFCLPQQRRPSSSSSTTHGCTRSSGLQP